MGTPPYKDAFLSDVAPRTASFVALQGVNGRTIAGGEAAVDAWLATQPTDVTRVVLNLGTNDIFQGLPSEAQASSDYAYILDAFHVKWPDAIVVCVKPWYTAGAADAATLATWIDTVLSTRGAWTLSINEADFLPGLISADGIHPNAAGYAATAAALATVMGY